MANAKPAKISFRAHPNHLRNTVLRQAGTLWKAILEGVMNSIDAGASKCEITLSKNKVIIADDGKGFKTKKELDEHFAQFGTPHEEGDAKYGEFRMGRGQLMAFGQNVWTTQQFVMRVDVLNKGMEYELESVGTDKKYKGCKVEITLYEPLTVSQELSAVSELEKYVKYVDIPVLLNGEQISQDPANQQWDHVTDEAYIKLTDHGDLKVYNLGVYVNSLSAYEVGCGGEVVSRQRLRLNFARNDVIRSGAEKCPNWAKISPYLKSTVQKRLAKKPVLTDAARFQTLRTALQERVTDFENMKLFPLINGKRLTLPELVNQIRICDDKITVAAPGNQLADRILQCLGAAVLDTQILVALSCTDVSLVDRLKLLCKTQGSWYSSLEVKYIPLDEFDLPPPDYKIVDEKNLRTDEKNVLKIINGWAKYAFVRSIRGNTREVLIGDTDPSVDGWTDGKTYIAVNRSFLARVGFTSLESAVKIGNLLLHEYCHDTLDAGSHVHGIEFYEAYHDSSDVVAEFVKRYLSSLTSLLRNFTKQQQKKLAKTVDSVAQTEAVVNDAKKTTKQLRRSPQRKTRKMVTR